MKMVKSLILGSAAGLVAVSGAQAADLPVKAKAVEYVRICSLYGAGFYYIPGTDTCIKLSGYLRADVGVYTNSDNTGNTLGPGGAKNRFTNYITTRGREDLSIDTRTATEYGVVRTYWDATFSWTTDSYTGTATGTSIYSSLGGVSAPNNANSGAVAGGTLGVYHAFIQFAGFTMGKTISPFSAPWVNYPAGNSFDGLVGGGGTVTGVDQLTYTADFGGGVSASIAAQDPTAYYQAGVNNLGATVGGAGLVSTGALGPFGTSDYGGTVAPDLIATVKADQAWGLVQLSVAAHDNHVAYYSGGVPFSGTELAGHPDDKWGFAVQGALQIKNVPTGAGDSIMVQGVYTDGATRYNIQDLAGGAGANTIFGGTSNPLAYQSIGFGIAPDTVFATGFSQQTIQTWGMRGGFNHNWTPTWSSGLYGAWASVRYNDTSKTLICGVGGVGGSFRATFGAGVVNCDPDYNIGQLGLITRWTPVKNLAFSADVTYTHLDQKMTGLAAFASTGIGKPAALYELRNQDTILLLLRAQRNW